MHRNPFTHIYATDVFSAEIYKRLSQEFAAIVDRTLAGAGSGPKMFKSGTNYDALILAISSSLSDRFAPIFTHQWQEIVSQLLNLPFTERVDGALHHIPRGSRSGWLHTDLCSGWFNVAATSLTDHEIIFPDRSQCDYFTGEPRNPGAKPEQYVRAASMIYYLNNDGWSEGDGGETELYSTARSDVGPKKAIAPKNNTVVIFECTPHSFHRLLANPGRHRNSIVVWFHTTTEFGQSRWGDVVSRKHSS